MGRLARCRTVVLSYCRTVVLSYCRVVRRVHTRMSYIVDAAYRPRQCETV